VIQWYNLLVKNNVTDFSETEASSEEE